MLGKFGKRNSSHFDFILFCSKLGFLPTTLFARGYGVNFAPPLDIRVAPSYSLSPADLLPQSPSN